MIYSVISVDYSCWLKTGGQRNISRKRGFQPTQRTQCEERKKRNEMTSLLDRPITATIKYEIIEIKFDLHHNLPQQVKNVLKFGLLFFF